MTQVRSVLSGPLTDGVSLTLHQDDYGWYFAHWSTQRWTPIHMQPDEPDRQRRFKTSEDGFRFFRRTYGPRLPTD